MRLLLAAESPLMIPVALLASLFKRDQLPIGMVRRRQAATSLINASDVCASSAIADAAPVLVACVRRCSGIRSETRG